MTPPSPHPQPIRTEKQHSTVCSQPQNASPSTLALAATTLPDPDLDERWARIKELLISILTRMQENPDAARDLKTPPNYWVAIYSGVASLYSGDNDTRKKRMYHHIRKFIDDHVGSQLSALRRYEGEELLAEYVKRWNVSLDFAGFMKRVLHHVQRYWIWDNANTLKEDPVRPLDNLFMFYWREHLLTHMPSFVDVALNMVDDDRRGKKVPRHLIRGLVDNLLTIGHADIFTSPDSDSATMQQRPHTHSTLYLYQQLFEEPFIAATTSYYQHDGRVSVNSSDVRAFIRDISARLRNEDERAADLLHPTSLAAVRRAAEEQLIGSHCGYLQERAKAMIESGSEADLSYIYNLLMRVDGGLVPVRNFVTSFIRGQGNTIVIRHVSSLNGSGEIRKSLCLIDRLICLYLKHAGMVRRCLSGSNDFKLAIYDAFRGFVNRSLGPISLPVLLAHFADQVFRTKTTPIAFARAVRELDTPPRTAAVDDEHEVSTDGGAPSEDSHQAARGTGDNESEHSHAVTARPDPQKLDTDSSPPEGETSRAEHRTNRPEVDASNGEHDAIQPAPQRPSAKRRRVGDMSAGDMRGRATSSSAPLKRKRARTGAVLATPKKSGRKGVRDEELSTKCLTEVVRFFMFLEEKDSFFETHRMLFSKRLLSSHDEMMEKQFIVELEEQMGAMYTHRLRGMLRDIMTSDTMRKDFSAYLEKLREIDERLASEHDSEGGAEGGTAGRGDKASEDDIETHNRQVRRLKEHLFTTARARRMRQVGAAVDAEPPAAGPTSPAPHLPGTPIVGGPAPIAQILDHDSPAGEPDGAASAAQQAADQNGPEAGASAPQEAEAELGAGAAPEEDAGGEAAATAAAETQPVDQQQQQQQQQQQEDEQQQQQQPPQAATPEGQEQAQPSTQGEQGGGAENAETAAPKKPATGPEQREAGRLALSLDFNTHVLNALHWPGVGSGSSGLRVPGVIQSCERLYQQFYMLERESRKLTWARGMATAQIIARFGGPGTARRGAKRSFTLLVSAVQMSVLVALNGRDGKSVTFEELGAELAITVEEMRKAVRPLVVGRRSHVLRILNNGNGDGPGESWEKAGQDEEKKEDRVCVNEDFDSASVRIVVPTAVQRVERADAAAARRVAVVDRNTLIDAAVVRVMKERKEVTFVELCTEVISRVSASVVSVDSRTIKPRVERLIDMEYVERDPEDAKVYRYCA